MTSPNSALYHFLAEHFDSWKNIMITGAEHYDFTHNTGDVHSMSTKRLKWCDLYCGPGGAGKGIILAGCDVIGVDLDLKCKPYYPSKFVEWDVLNIEKLIELDGTRFIDQFDGFWASCPCQGNSQMTNIRGKKTNHPDFIGPTREILERLGKPYIIENVIGAPLRVDVIIYGYMVGLPLLRPRIFECSFPVEQPKKLKRKDIPPELRQRYSVVGRLVSTKRNGGNARYEDMKYWWPIEMGIDWIPLNVQTSDGQNMFSQAIPPAFSKYLIEQSNQELEART